MSRWGFALFMSSSFCFLVVGLDIELGWDLSDPATISKIKDEAKAGRFHGAHAGFPCSSFSRLRWRDGEGLPGPVRSRFHMYGLPTNTAAQQAEADRGTLMACNSIEILELVEGSGKGGWPTTAENPPPSDHPHALSAFELPEVARWTERPGVHCADFNTCIYARSEAGERPYKKPQRIVGTLEGLASLSGTCKCEKSFVHPKVLGAEASKDSAAYPWLLCLRYAELVVSCWMARADRPHHCVTQPVASPEIIAEAEWRGGRGRHGGLHATPSKRAIRDQENKDAIGGLRRPLWAIERFPGIRAVGREVSQLFDKFVRRYPAAEEAAAGYGTKGFELKYVEEWRRELRLHFGLGDRDGVVLTPKIGFKTPVDVALLEAWAKKAADPETAVTRWLASGAPLGANASIETCNIFPEKSDDEQACAIDAETKAWAEAQNYKSFSNNPQEADEEMQRLIDKGFVKKLTVEEAEIAFGRTALSRLGLIVKDKPDGSKKRRVIVDARRSGANQRARCPERIVLPRPEDVHFMLRSMKEGEPDLLAYYRNESMSTADWGAEFVAADLTDAFCHYPVSERELQQCLSPAGDHQHVYVFTALFFGHKSAPLLMCRLAALLTRLLQGLHWQAELQLGTYVDDPLLALVGSLRRRNRNLSLTLLTLAAWGIQLALHKGARGTCLVWIGVQFNMKWREGSLRVEVPEKLRLEIVDKLNKWQHAGMVPFTELRSFAGKLTWAANIYKRSRWAVAMIYAALCAHEADVKSGVEATRRNRRTDTRTKDHLVPVKRFETARRWLLQLFSKQALVTNRPLWRQKETVMFITDASPQGCGGILLLRAHEKKPWTLYQAYEYPIDKHDAELLGFQCGSHKSQAYLEALAIFVALKLWGPVLLGIPLCLAVRSDSTVALSLLQKSSSSSPALNTLAAELSLLLEHLKVGDVALSHVPGKLNTLADWLSRPQTRGEAPKELAEVKIKRPAKLREADFLLGTRSSHDASPAGVTWDAIVC